MEGGTLQNGTFRIAGGSTAQLFATSGGGDLDGETLDSPIVLNARDSLGNAPSLGIKEGLVLNTTLNVGNVSGTTPGFLDFFNAASTTDNLTGTGTIVLGGSTSNRVFFDAASMTIGSGIVIDGNAGTVGETTSFINDGEILADGPSTSGLTVDFGPASVNDGTLEAVNGGTLNIGGSVTTANLNQVVGGGSNTINLVGTLNNTGSTLELSSTTGSWNVINNGGDRGRGNVVTDASESLNNQDGTRNGVTLGGTGTSGGEPGNLNLTQAGGLNKAFVENGLTLLNNSVISLGSPTNTNNYGILEVTGGTQALAGAGNIVFGASLSNGLTNDSGTLTVGPNLFVHGQNGAVNGTILNNGAIDADVAGGTVTIGGGFANSGTVEAQNGGDLSVQTSAANFSAGTLIGGTWAAYAGSTVQLTTSSPLTTNAASIGYNGPGSKILNTVSGNTVDLPTTLNSNAAAGVFSVLSGASFEAAPGFTNAGNLNVGSTSRSQRLGDELDGTPASRTTGRETAPAPTAAVAATTRSGTRRPTRRARLARHSASTARARPSSMEPSPLARRTSRSGSGSRRPTPANKPSWAIGQPSRTGTSSASG